MGFFSKIAEGLKKTKDAFSDKIKAVFSADKLDDDFFDDLEETLIISDFGAETSMTVVDRLREEVETKHITSPEKAKALFQEI